MPEAHEKEETSLKKPNFLQKEFRSSLLAGLIGWAVCLIGNMVDSIFAGLLISEEAVAAVALVSPVFTVMLFVSFLFNSGTCTLFSRAKGAFDREQSYRVCGMGLLVCVISGVILSGALYMAEDFYFGFYSSQPAVETLAREYYGCFGVMALVYPVYWLLFYLVVEDGDEKNGIAATAVSMTANLFFSWFLVRRIGIRGLGYGTVISVGFSCLVSLSHFAKKSNSIRFRFYWNWKTLGKIFVISSTTAFTTLFVAVTDIVMNKYIIVRFGELYLTAYTVVNMILNFAECFVCVGDAAGPFICVGYGENNPVALRKIMKIMTRAALMIMLFFVAAVEIFAPLLPRFYGISDPEIYENAVYSGRVLAVSYIGAAFVFELGSYYARINKTYVGMVGMSFYSLIAPLSLPFVFSSFWGYRGLVWGFVFAPYVSLLAVYATVALKYGIRRFPMIVKNEKDRIFIHDLTLTVENIIDLRDTVEQELESVGVSSGIIIRACLMVEETLLIVREKNVGKTLLADCTVMVSDTYVRMTTRDSGRIFDITDQNAKVRSLGAYMTAQLMEDSHETFYLTTVSYNRNSYVWERERIPDDDPIA